MNAFRYEEEHNTGTGNIRRAIVGTLAVLMVVIFVGQNYSGGGAPATAAPLTTTTQAVAVTTPRSQKTTTTTTNSCAGLTAYAEAVSPTAADMADVMDDSYYWANYAIEAQDFARGSTEFSKLAVRVAAQHRVVVGLQPPAVMRSGHMLYLQSLTTFERAMNEVASGLAVISPTQISAAVDLMDEGQGLLGQARQQVEAALRECR